MLVLSRKHRESVVVGGGGGIEHMLKVTVLEIAGGRVKLGFEGDGDIPVHRLEIWERLCAGSGDVGYAGKDRRHEQAGNASSVSGGMLGMVALIAEERKEQQKFHGQNGDAS